MEYKEQIINTFYYKRTNKKTGKDIFNIRRYLLSIYNKEENMHHNSEAQAEFKELKSYIENTFKDEYNNIEDNLKEILYRIKYDIEEIPKCPIC